MNKGLGCAMALIIVMAVACATGVYLVASRIADNVPAREVTKQVEIRANADVAIAQTNANAAVKMAEIAADTTKKTTGAFTLFYVARALLWAMGLCVVAVVVVALLMRNWGEE